MGDGQILRTELGGVGHYGNISEVRLQEDFLVSSVSLVLGRLTDTHNA